MLIQHMCDCLGVYRASFAFLRASDEFSLRKQILHSTPKVLPYACIVYHVCNLTPLPKNFLRAPLCT